eukprot:4653617-Amphidinium_carterae.1
MPNAPSISGDLFSMGIPRTELHKLCASAAWRRYCSDHQRTASRTTIASPRCPEFAPDDFNTLKCKRESLMFITILRSEFILRQSLIKSHGQHSKNFFQDAVVKTSGEAKWQR